MLEEYLELLRSSALIIGIVMLLFWLGSVKATADKRESIFLKDISFLCSWIEIRTMRSGTISNRGAGGSLFIAFFGIGLSIWTIGAILAGLFAMQFPALFIMLS